MENLEFEKRLQRLEAELVELKLSRAKKALHAVRRNRRTVLAGGIMGLIIPVAISALSITKTHTFTAGNPTVASEINTNFDQLFTKVNDLAAYHPPIGTILAWHKSLSGVPGLPGTGEWVECSGQTLVDSNSPLNGRTIPNLNGAASTGHFLRGSDASGVFQQDTFQGHWHVTGAGGVPFPQSTNGTLIESGDTWIQSPSNATVRSPISDNINGTPRTAGETRPVNMSVVWIMKVK